MSGSEHDFDTTLDLLLASRRDPVVPVGLARRIVVRTAHLPQSGVTDAEHRCSERPADGLSIAGGNHRQVRFGGAIAASLALLVCGNGLFYAANPPARVESALTLGADPGRAKTSSHPAASAASIAAMVGGAGKADRTREAASSDQARRIASADEVLSRAKSRKADRRVEPVGSSNGPPVLIVEPTYGNRSVDLRVFASNAENSPALARIQQASGIDSFALAEDVAPPEPVYGPVLEPEAGAGLPAFAPAGSAPSGLAFGSGGAGGSGRR
mgnify:CR=1 FL=1